MSTRGSFGFVANGVLKLTYNHYDSYPTSLGSDLAIQLVSMMAGGYDQKQFIEAGTAVRLVDEDSKPTIEDQCALKGFMDLNVGECSPDDWYCLLRHTQGQLKEILERVKVMIDGNYFPLDSLFCEWAYVADFDKMVFEVYKGFQEKKHRKGRFCADMSYVNERQQTGRSEYYPVKLVKTFDINKDLAVKFKKWAAAEDAKERNE